MRHSGPRTLAVPLVLASVLSSCGGAPQSAPPGEKSARSRAPAPIPGEEPLETESIGDDEVTGLPPERRAAAQTVPPAGRPCGWSNAWTDDSVPNPLVPGVGDIPNPVRLSEEPIRLPARDPLPRGQIVVELVIGPDGAVREARVVHSTDPPWPSADRAVERAVVQWRYEPPALGGTPITICSTTFVRP